MLRMSKPQRNTNLGTVAIAALVGGLAGAVVGLMFAPKSGKELRQGLQDKADHVLEQVENSTFHHTEVLKQQGTDLVGKGKKLADDLQSYIQESLKLKKSDNIPVTIAKDTQLEETHQPQIQVQPENPLQEE